MCAWKSVLTSAVISQWSEDSWSAFSPFGSWTVMLLTGHFFHSADDLCLVGILSEGCWVRQLLLLLTKCFCCTTLITQLPHI